VRILFLGDIVGEPGRKILRDHLSSLRKRLELDLVIANAENAAAGSGLSPSCWDELRKAGVDAATMGDHVYKRKEIRTLFERGEPICRPANYPSRAVGPELLLISAGSDRKVAIFQVQGRLFLRPADCPFDAADRILARIPDDVRVILVDVHAEATAEKQTIFRFLAGRVTAALGTHTHVPTADAGLIGTTACITDLGMTGPYDGVIGRRFEPVLKSALSFEVNKFDVAVGDPRISGALIEADPDTGHARSIRLVHLTEEQLASGDTAR
jgi:hypothetical protein